MREVFGMPDGIAQQERDAQIAMDPHEGCPIALADPMFQKWLWGYNAVEDANGSKGKGKNEYRFIKSQTRDGNMLFA